MENRKGVELDDIELEWDYKLVMIVYGVLVVLMLIWYVKEFILR